MTAFLLERGDALAVALVAVVSHVVFYLAHVHTMRAQRAAHRAMRDADRAHHYRLRAAARADAAARWHDLTAPTPEQPLDPYTPDLASGGHVPGVDVLAMVQAGERITGVKAR